MLAFRDFSQNAEKQTTYTHQSASCVLSQNRQETLNNLIIPVNSGINTSVDGIIETFYKELYKSINASVDDTYKKIITGNTEKKSEEKDSALDYADIYQKKMKDSAEKIA